MFDSELTKVKDQGVLGVGAVVGRYLEERSAIVTRSCESLSEP